MKYVKLFEEIQKEPAYIATKPLLEASYLNENDEESRLWNDKVESIRFELEKTGYEELDTRKGKWSRIIQPDNINSISWWLRTDGSNDKVYVISDATTVDVPGGDKQLKFSEYFTENPKRMGYHKMKKFGI